MWKLNELYASVVQGGLFLPNLALNTASNMFHCFHSSQTKDCFHVCIASNDNNDKLLRSPLLVFLVWSRPPSLKYTLMIVTTPHLKLLISKSLTMFYQFQATATYRLQRRLVGPSPSYMPSSVFPCSWSFWQTSASSSRGESSSCGPS